MPFRRTQQTTHPKTSKAISSMALHEGFWQMVSDDVFRGHDITELVLNGTKIAGQKTHDFFGDGSLTLIDMPGVSGLRILALCRLI
jgi:hypothetical protein